MKKYQHTGKAGKFVGKGRKPKTSKREDSCILKTVKEGH